ncbi:MAG TPA: hypothetical protein VKP69_27950 [Isosphaeraceae bacterium]|nr:hypothetical protein [Isosphaeraceae bacterium]
MRAEWPGYTLAQKCAVIADASVAVVVLPFAKRGTFNPDLLGPMRKT